MSLEFNRRRPMRRSLSYLLVAATAGLIASGAGAQEPPALQGASAQGEARGALQGASAQEKSRVTALIDAAKQEGALTYWDVVIQPETNDALAAEFRKTYGLPSSVPVKSPR